MKILVVDDEKSVREGLRRYLSIEGMEVECAENGLAARRMLGESVYAAAVVDLRMPGMNGLELLSWIREAGLRLPVLMISAFGEVSDAVEAMKRGARDYLVKPFDAGELVLRLRRAAEDQALQDAAESGRRAAGGSGRLVGASAAMARIRRLIEQVAATPSTVVITGESGCGKEVVAREIHARSADPAAPFVAINLGGLPETLAESELFGYEKGAFTGAAARKIGLFELAARGTLFLDEIGDMPPGLQVKLLRVLQERRIMRLGGTNPIPIGARLIAATNHDLEEAVRKGAFREDLFFRLNVIRIEVPPLRERMDDLPILAGACIDRLNRSLGRSIEGISSPALRKLASYRFPGNVRELENILERACIFCRGASLEADDIDLPSSAAGYAEALSGRPESARPPDGGGGRTLHDIERAALVEALRRWEGNRTKAAEELGIARRTIINKIRHYAIDIPAGDEQD